MKNRLFLYLLIFTFGSLSSQERYLDEVFTNITSTTVQYSQAYELDMDIYIPNGDSLNERPLIIFAHGGGFISGSKEDDDIITLCNSFSKRGYTTASISYRLTTISCQLDSLCMIDIVFKAVSDARAAIRYFKQDYSIYGNTYNIDTSKIYFTGNSAGAVIAVQLACLNDESKLSTYTHLNNIMLANGGFNGDSGNPGYTSEISAGASLAGAVHKLSWLDSNTRPLISFHGTEDWVVPFNCSLALGGISAQLCGSSEIHNKLDTYQIPNSLTIFPGDEHCPWSSDNVKLNQCIDSISIFFYTNLTETTYIDTSITNATISGQLTYSNNNSTPLTNVVINLINNQNQIVSSTISDLNGNYSFNNINSGTYTISCVSTANSGGINSTDALISQQHFTGESILNGMFFKSADVNNSNIVNSTDALLIRQNFVNITQFDEIWIFEQQEFIVNSNFVNHNIKSICFGDVNGSFIPAN